MSVYIAVAARRKGVLSDIDVLWIEPQVRDTPGDKSSLSTAAFIDELQTILKEKWGLSLGVNVSAEARTSFPSPFSRPWHLCAPRSWSTLVAFYGDLYMDFFRLLNGVLTGNIPDLLIGANIPEYRFYRMTLESRNVRGVICSMSSLGGKQSWVAGSVLANIPSMMLCYSTNSIAPLPVTKIGFEFRTALQSTFLVWDSGFANWLVEEVGISQTRVQVIGPIMFASVHPSMSADLGALQEINNSIPRIGLFDVTPITDAALARLGFGTGFYSQTLCERFVQDIIEEGISINPDVIFLFKLKRTPLKGFHNDAYLQFLEMVQSKYSKNFRLISPKENPWSTILACNIILGNAYTSIVDAAAYIGLPAAYYYPSEDAKTSLYKSQPLFTSRLHLSAWLRTQIAGPQVLGNPNLIATAQEKLGATIAKTIRG